MKCPGSGEEARNHWPNLDLLRADKDEVKFVIANRDDWDFARDIIKRFELEKRALAILISPVWNNLDLQEVASWITSSRLKVRMQLQMHKYIYPKHEVFDGRS